MVNGKDKLRSKFELYEKYGEWESWKIFESYCVSQFRAASKVFLMSSMSFSIDRKKIIQHTTEEDRWKTSTSQAQKWPRDYTEIITYHWKCGSREIE